MHNGVPNANYVDYPRRSNHVWASMSMRGSTLADIALALLVFIVLIVAVVSPHLSSRGLKTIPNKGGNYTLVYRVKYSVCNSPGGAGFLQTNLTLVYVNGRLVKAETPLGTLPPSAFSFPFAAGFTDELTSLSYIPNNGTVIKLPEGTITKTVRNIGNVAFVDTPYDVSNAVEIVAYVSLSNFTRPGMAMRFIHLEAHYTVVKDKQTGVPIYFDAIISHPAVMKAFGCDITTTNIFAYLIEVK